MLLVVIIVVCNLSLILLTIVVLIIMYTRLHTATTFLATRMPTSISIEPFDVSKLEWDSWSRRFDQWLKISTYTEGKHATDKIQAAFCTFIGSDAFKLLYSLCAPKKPEECMYSPLKTTFNMV